MNAHDHSPPTTCFACGERAIETTRDPIRFEFREGAWSLEPGFDYERCTSCGEEYYPGPEMTELTREAVATASTDLGLLTPDAIRSLRHELNLTQADLERAIGVSRGTVGRWERGDVLHSATADRLMRAIREVPELLQTEALAFVARESRGPYRKGR